jgi:hypothetical protein
MLVKFSRAACTVAAEAFQASGGTVVSLVGTAGAGNPGNVIVNVPPVALMLIV